MKKFDYILKYSPLIYASLIFFGFLDNAFFYKCFNLNIIHYISLGEFLLSFISITDTLIFIILGIIGTLTFLGLVKVFPWSKNYKNPFEGEENIEEKVLHNSLLYNRSHLELKKELVQFKNNLVKLQILRIIGGLVAIFFTLFLVLLKLTLWVVFFTYFFIVFEAMKYPDLTSVDSFSKLYYGISIVLTVIWIFTIRDILSITSKVDNSYPYSKIKVILSCFAIIFLMKLSNEFKAYDLIYGESKQYVSFKIDKKTHQTNKDTVYIGRTSDYIFLWDKTSNKNLVFKNSEIKIFETGLIK